MKKISARRPVAADCRPAPAERRALELRELELRELEQVTAAGSKPGGAGDGRGLPGDRREAP